MNINDIVLKFTSYLFNICFIVLVASIIAMIWVPDAFYVRIMATAGLLMIVTGIVSRGAEQNRMDEHYRDYGD